MLFDTRVKTGYNCDASRIAGHRKKAGTWTGFKWIPQWSIANPRFAKPVYLSAILVGSLASGLTYEEVAAQYGLDHDDALFRSTQ